MRDFHANGAYQRYFRRVGNHFCWLETPLIPPIFLWWKSSFWPSVQLMLAMFYIPFLHMFPYVSHVFPYFAHIPCFLIFFPCFSHISLAYLPVFTNDPLVTLAPDTLPASRPGATEHFAAIARPPLERCHGSAPDAAMGCSASNKPSTKKDLIGKIASVRTIFRLLGVVSVGLRLLGLVVSVGFGFMIINISRNSRNSRNYGSYVSLGHGLLNDWVIGWYWAIHVF